MDYALTQKQVMIRNAARKFAQERLADGAIERDEKEEIIK